MAKCSSIGGFGFVVAFLLTTHVEADVLCANPGPQRPGMNNSLYGSQMIAMNLGGKSGQGCADACVPGPANFTPAIQHVCEGEPAKLNFRIDGTTASGALQTRGDSIIQHRGEVDWGDGQKTDLGSGSGYAGPNSCCNFTVTHPYVTASPEPYAPSACYTQDFKNDNNPKGGCSARCGGTQLAHVIVHPASAPECSGGVYHAASASKKTAASKAKATSQMASKPVTTATTSK